MSRNELLASALLGCGGFGAGAGQNLLGQSRWREYAGRRSSVDCGLKRWRLACGYGDPAQNFGIGEYRASRLLTN